jgi:hypothetical protein
MINLVLIRERGVERREEKRREGVKEISPPHPIFVFKKQ